MHGNVIDHSCPCTVNNRIAPLGAVGFKEMGWGTHMMLHVYDIMNPSYVPPTTRNNFKPVTIPKLSSEDDQFYIKIVNQYTEDILVYLDAPPAWKGERVNRQKW